jgi:hypothetical protein
MHLITQPVNVLPCSSSAIKGDNGTKRIPRYWWPNRHRTSSVFHCWNQAFRILGVLRCYPNVKDGSSDYITRAFPVVWCPGFMVVTPSFTHMSITFSNEKFSNCSPTAGAGLVKFTSDSFFKQGLQDEYLVLLQFTCAAVVLCFSK